MLKAKVSDLKEKNKVLSEQLSKGGGYPTTNGNAKTATEELESELADLKTWITIIEEAVRFYRILHHSRSEATNYIEHDKLQAHCKDAEARLAALAAESVLRIRDTNDKMIARHAKELKGLEDGFGAKEKDIFAQIKALKTSFESLEARQGGEAHQQKKIFLRTDRACFRMNSIVSLRLVRPHLRCLPCLSSLASGAP